MNFLVIASAFLASAAMASDGTGDVQDAKVLEFLSAPAAPQKKMTCAQAKSRSPFAFNAQCGLGYTAVRAYVTTTDQKHCYIGTDCYLTDSSSNR